MNVSKKKLLTFMTTMAVRNKTYPGNFIEKSQERKGYLK